MLRAVSTSQDQTAQVWDARTGQHIFTFTGQMSPVTWGAWSPDGTRIVTGAGLVGGVGDAADNVAKVWYAKTGKTLVTYKGHTAYLNAVEWSPDGTRIATGGASGVVAIWRVM